MADKMKKEGNNHKNHNNHHPVLKRQLTFGQKASDKLTHFCGSWKFIIGILVYLLIWIYLNLTAYLNHWDPWPFIILNLTLSCLAALQAPIILMSQNREAERDRINARYDYIVNRKAEREIANLQKDLNGIKKLLRMRKKRKKK